jgi:hypothetical protein
MNRDEYIDMIVESSTSVYRLQSNTLLIAAVWDTVQAMADEDKPVTVELSDKQSIKLTWDDRFVTVNGHHIKEGKLFLSAGFHKPFSFTPHNYLKLSLLFRGYMLMPEGTTLLTPRDLINVEDLHDTIDIVCYALDRADSLLKAQEKKDA